MTVSSGPAVRIKVFILKAPFRGHFFESVARRPLELWIVWCAFGSSLWVISSPHHLLEGPFTWKHRLILPCIYQGPRVPKMSGIWSILPWIRTICSPCRRFVPDICYQVWSCSSLGSSRDALVKHSNHHGNQWALLRREYVAEVLIFH